MRVPAEHKLLLYLEAIWLRRAGKQNHTLSWETQVALFQVVLAAVGRHTPRKTLCPSAK